MLLWVISVAFEPGCGWMSVAVCILNFDCVMCFRARLKAKVTERYFGRGTRYAGYKQEGT
jgi:hypothetical protein